jgi:hypothetical protein
VPRLGRVRNGIERRFLVARLASLPRRSFKSGPYRTSGYRCSGEGLPPLADAPGTYVLQEISPPSDAGVLVDGLSTPKACGAA